MKQVFFFYASPLRIPEKMLVHQAINDLVRQSMSDTGRTPEVNFPVDQDKFCVIKPVSGEITVVYVQPIEPVLPSHTLPLGSRVGLIRTVSVHNSEYEVTIHAHVTGEVAWVSDHGNQIGFRVGALTFSVPCDALTYVND